MNLHKRCNLFGLAFKRNCFPELPFPGRNLQMLLSNTPCTIMNKKTPSQMHSRNIIVSASARVHPAVIFTYDIVGPRPALVQKNIA